MGAGVRDAFPPPMCCVDCLRGSFGRLISLGRIVRGCITEIGRGGACVPARVAPQGRIRHSPPTHNAYIFVMETSLRGRSGGHTGTAPTVSFGQITRGTVGFVWVDCVQMVILFVWDCVEKYYGDW